MVPIVSGGKVNLSWMEWNQSRKGKGSVSTEAFELIINASPRSTCAATYEDVDEAAQVLQSISEALNAKMGNLAPGLTSLRQAVFECRTLAKQILDRKGAEVEDAPADSLEQTSEGAGGNNDGGGSSLGRAVQSRAQVYARLAEVAEILAQLEPHSPIPYLIRHAVRLGDLSFPDLIKALVSDSSTRDDLGRKLGIEDLRN